MTTGLDHNSYLRTYYKENMCKFISLCLLLCSILLGSTDCTSSFDQRQTGDFNVQIGLKNIQLIALLKGGNEEYVDYDYAYDYSEMTIKPQNGTTPKPLKPTNTQTQNVTTLTPIADNATESSVLFSNQHINGTTQNLNATAPNINATGSNVNATVETMVQIANQTNIIAANYSIQSTTQKVVFEEGPTTVSSDSTSAVPVVHCRRGFVQNTQGKCEYKGHGTTNALRRIVKLAQKIKIGRNYKGT